MADMSNEQAARVLTKEADGWGDERVLFETYKTALRMGAAALRGPVPDPDAGLVPCGCGERVSISFYPGWAGTPDLYQVDCFSCHVGTRPCQTAEQAKTAWNTAMGWRVEG